MKGRRRNKEIEKKQGKEQE
jgi:hypothetical protein